MTLSEARGWAAHAWCGPKTNNKVMDPDLAEEFARILRERVNATVAALTGQALVGMPGVWKPPPLPAPPDPPAKLPIVSVGWTIAVCPIDTFLEAELVQAAAETTHAAMSDPKVPEAEPKMKFREFL